MVSNQDLSICCCSFLWEDCFFRNRMKWADGKLRSLQKNQLFFPFGNGRDFIVSFQCFGAALIAIITLQYALSSFVILSFSA